VPLVLHGGSGIRRECLQQAFRRGIAKINIGTTIRQAYEQGARVAVAQGQQAVYDTLIHIIRGELQVEGSAKEFQADASGNVL